MVSMVFGRHAQSAFSLDRRNTPRSQRPRIFREGKAVECGACDSCNGGRLGLFRAPVWDRCRPSMPPRLPRLAALLPISTFFGAEAIFLVLFLVVFACGMRLLNENPLRLYLLLGMLTALGVAGEVLHDAFSHYYSSPSAFSVGC